MIKHLTHLQDADLALFERGLSVFTKDKILILNGLMDYISNHAVLVGPNSFVIVYFPPKDALSQIPQVLHLHSEGGRKETRALVDAVLNFVRERGYNTLRAINGSGRRDDIWLRAFRHKDWKQKPVKTVFDFEVK